MYNYLQWYSIAYHCSCVPDESSNKLLQLTMEFTSMCAETTTSAEDLQTSRPKATHYTLFRPTQSLGQRIQSPASQTQPFATSTQSMPSSNQSSVNSV